MRQFSIKCRLCSISSGCRCNGGGHAHVQGGGASGDSSGSENIGRLRQRRQTPTQPIVLKHLPSMDEACKVPLRFLKTMTEGGSSGDEFGILEDSAVIL